MDGSNPVTPRFRDEVMANGAFVRDSSLRAARCVQNPRSRSHVVSRVLMEVYLDVSVG